MGGEHVALVRHAPCDERRRIQGAVLVDEATARVAVDPHAARVEECARQTRSRGGGEQRVDRQAVEVGVARGVLGGAVDRDRARLGGGEVRAGIVEVADHGLDLAALEREGAVVRARETEHVVAATGERGGDSGADVAGGAGQEDAHRRGGEKKDEDGGDYTAALRAAGARDRSVT
jgi:hypothetical protein